MDEQEKQTFERMENQLKSDLRTEDKMVLPVYVLGAVAVVVLLVGVYLATHSIRKSRGMDPDKVELDSAEKLTEIAEERYGDAELLSCEDYGSGKERRRIARFRDVKYGFTYTLISKPAYTSTGTLDGEFGRRIYDGSTEIESNYATALSKFEDSHRELFKKDTSEEDEREAKMKEQMTLATPLKRPWDNNPLMTQRLGADPYALVYDGRVYIYMTADVIETNADGSPKANSYQKINKINVISSDDLVNWTDHGSVFAAGADGAAKWGGNSWAPAAACKEVDGKMQFFLYFANSGNGIGVLRADSPVGPFTDPIGKALINRDTPNCANVTWLFDPAVLVDEDGSAYLYVGGGVPGYPPTDEQIEHPRTARVVKLGADMISLDGDPVAIDPPFLFEDSGINRIGDTYYYSYCSNFNVDGHANAKKYNLANGQICYMTSGSPMGPFTYQGAILKNPGSYFGPGGNNHHCIFEFNGKYYITYHSQILDEPLKTGGGYRCTHIDELTVNEDGSIPMGKGTKTGVSQVKYLDPYTEVNAATMATMAGIDTKPYTTIAQKYGSGRMSVTKIDNGDWILVKGVDFGSEGAKMFYADYTLYGGTGSGEIIVRLDDLNNGPDVATLKLVGNTGGTQVAEGVTGVRDVYFIFVGGGFDFNKWYFK